MLNIKHLQSLTDQALAVRQKDAEETSTQQAAKEGQLNEVRLDKIIRHIDAYTSVVAERGESICSIGLLDDEVVVTTQKEISFTTKGLGSLLYQYLSDCELSPKIVEAWSDQPPEYGGVSRDYYLIFSWRPNVYISEQSVHFSKLYAHSVIHRGVNAEGREWIRLEYPKK